MKSSYRVYGVRRKAARWVGVQIAAMLLVMPVGASADGLVRFNIPPQNANTALTAFAEQAGIPILFPYARVGGVMANRLVGAYTVEEGLATLLAGTGLDAVIIRDADQPTVRITEETRENTDSPGFFATILHALSGKNRTGAGPTQKQGFALEPTPMLEEVVVTARRREESLMELPLSIQAITANAMETQGIYTMDDISDYVPNVTLMVAGRSNLGSVIIRGIGGGSPEPAVIYGSAMYLDGHYMPARQNGFMSTLDIERVEVLRGPQGTLFGKNVTGGLVNIITAKPGPEFNASVTVRAAENGEQDLRGTVNFPISDNVFARLSASSEQMDGYYFNQHLNIDAGATDLQAFNGALRFTPNNNWTLDFSVNRQERDDQNRAYQCNPYDGSAPTWGGGIGHLNRVYDAYEDDLRAACAADAAAGLFVASSDHVTFSNVEVNSAFATAQWDGVIGGLENATFKVQGSWQDTKFSYYLDRDHSFYPIGEMGHPIGAEGCVGKYCGQPSTTRGWEALFEAQVNDRLNYTVGVNYFWELHKIGDGRCRQRFVTSGAGDLDPDNPTIPTPDGGVLPNPASGDITMGVDCNDAKSGLVVAPLLNPDPSSGPQPFILSVRGENESVGIFGHMTYALKDNWDLDLGVRWTKDDREYWNFENQIQGCMPPDNPQQRSLGNITAQPDVYCGFSYYPTFETALIKGFHNDFADSWSEVTPMASLTRNLQGGDTLDSGMVYFLYSEGFLSGGFNTELNSNLPALQGTGYNSFGPEHVSNYEVGFKGTLLDGRLQISSDVFYMDYQDKQESIELSNEGGVFGPDEGSPLDVRTNVASARISGIELELYARLWQRGLVSLHLGTLDSRYSSFQYPDPFDLSATIDQSSKSLANRIPDWTLSLGIEHKYTLANGASLTPRIQFYSQDNYDYAARTVGIPPSPFCNQEPYTKINTRLTYRPAADNWRVSLFGYNITDKEILGACENAIGVWHYWHQRPSWWGLEFTRDWGTH